MELNGISALVTGGASGLGRATAEHLAAAGAQVVIVDLPSSDGEAVAGESDSLAFVPADVTDESAIASALDEATRLGELRAVVHCAGRGGPIRVVDRDGAPGSQEAFEAVVRTNLFGTWNVLRQSAARMAANEPRGGERGAIVLTASVAAFEGQIGQASYAASKAAVHGLTLCAARDLASSLIRVCTIAPGLFDTPLLGRLRPDIKEALARTVPHPSRLGSGSEYAALALSILTNPMLNGETIRLDGALRMAPR